MNESHPKPSGVEQPIEVSAQISTKTKADLNRWVRAGLKEKILKLPTLDIPRNLLTALIPQRAYEIALHPEKLELAVAEVEKGPESESIELLLVERDFPNALTDLKDFQDFRTKLDLNIRAGILGHPKRPVTVDRLHVMFRNHVDEGVIQLTDKIIFALALSKSHYSPSILNVVSYDGQIQQGLATDFYLNTLPYFAKTLGFRFVAGSNNTQNTPFFTQKLGRVHSKDLKAEAFSVLFPNEYSDEITVQFLYPEDKKRYLKTP